TPRSWLRPVECHACNPPDFPVGFGGTNAALRRSPFQPDRLCGRFWGRRHGFCWPSRGAVRAPPVPGRADQQEDRSTVAVTVGGFRCWCAGESAAGEPASCGAVDGTAGVAASVSAGPPVS